jgi:hypothetical protein
LTQAHRIVGVFGSFFCRTLRNAQACLVGSVEKLFHTSIDDFFSILDGLTVSARRGQGLVSIFTTYSGLDVQIFGSATTV